MNLFFDEESQKIIINAKKEMYELKHPYVGSEHLLLAILKDCNLDVTKRLNSFGIYYDDFRGELIKVIGVGSKCNDWFLFTPLLKRIINNSIFYSKSHDNVVTVYSLLISILQEGDGVANRILLGMDIDLEYLYEKFEDNNNYSLKTSCKVLDEIGINLNQYALQNNCDPVIGREDEINTIIQVMLRKNKCNPLLIGDAGVGKTALIEELARRIVLKKVPLKLQNLVIYSISMSSLVAGTKYRGEFEDKMKQLISEVKSNNNIVLFIDEVHTIMGAGGAEGAIDASNIVKPYLARGDIRIIGTTTVYEYNKYILKDKAFDRRFLKIYVREPTRNQVTEILLKLKKLYEEYHNVMISDKIISSIVDLSYECISFGKQPDKAIDLLDSVCSFNYFNSSKDMNKVNKYELELENISKEKNRMIISHNFKKALKLKNKEMELLSLYNRNLFDSNSLTKKNQITMDDVYQVLYKKGMFINPVDYKNSLIMLKKKINSELFIQDKVCSDVINCLLKYDYIKNSKPLTLFMIGKSGVGKTFLIEKILNDVFKDTNCIKIDMNDYSDIHSIDRIKGINNYSTFQDAGVFSSIKDHAFSVIVIDNIFKAHPLVLKNIIQMLNNGFFYNSLNEKIYVKKCIIFITSRSIDDDIGFINKNNTINDNELFVNMNKFYFENITDKTLYNYLNRYLKYSITDTKKKKEIINDIIVKSNYQNIGMKKIDDLLNTICRLDKIKS